ncbi:bifunctional 3-phenylpropionate/cinnamic acid dioxygenase ferredoxin subunit [Rhodococcus sp. (in: high G+C Gram-positive bacteria)]|uniref:bifunctional 3-phenylpropionate/cinnamic acid dioxygenase ferredoxin subunit n=1 Tax=Rhodococcus sp. TaxID=1831 RepID=UPI003BB1DF40
MSAMTDYVVNEDLPDIEEKKWIRACVVDDLPEDEGLRLTTIPPVSVFASEDEYFCIDDTCTHETFSLAEGWVEDGVVECSLHLAKFSLRTGEVMCPPASVPVAVHPVTVIGDEVYVALPSNYLVKEGS